MTPNESLEGINMTHTLSSDDRRLRAVFEACAIHPEDFNHRTHVRLAFVYLVEHDTETALGLLRCALLNYLEHHGIDAAKYHETMTRAWLLAVRHFMEMSPPTASADAFIEGAPALLDGEIMLTHYSAEQLFSTDARRQFVEPDLAPIPRHDP